jgi:D-alanyl-D-alanine carboxypeptidase
MGLSATNAQATPAKHKHPTQNAKSRAHTQASQAKAKPSKSAQIAFDERYAAIVIDASTGRVLHEHEPDGLRYPASLTKMMTLYLTFEAIAEGRMSFQTQIPISPNASEQAPTKLGLRPGQTLAVRDAVLGLITRSANDAACALAEALAGSEPRFADQMTRKARQLGMTNTVYRNASGLPDTDQHTTARDQATLGLRLQRDFPEQYHLFATEEFRFRGAVIPNHNHLLRQYEGTDGLKTGFINASGFNLAASARRDGHRIVGVVFGGQSSYSRDLRMMQLLDHGFATLNGTPNTLVAIQQVHNARAVRMAAVNTAHETEEGDSDEETPKSTPQKAPVPKAVKPAGQLAAIPQSIGAGTWGIQVGAFRSSVSAKKQIDLALGAVPALTKAKAVVIPDRAKNPRNHRARLIGLSETDARNTCQALTDRSMPCLTLPPEEAKAG